MPSLTAVSVVIVSAAAGLVSLLQVSRLDFAVVLWVRSLHLPVVEHLGALGSRLGDEAFLLALCAGLWGLGWLRRNAAWRQAGIDAGVGHVLAGIAAQLFKRVVGRPRPRFTHRDVFDYGPSLHSGFDAFPSGHAAASFAAAAVLARAFPAWAWAWYSGAVFVGVSRVLQGSHFLTDVLAGAALGMFTGYVWARPLGEWRRHALRALTRTLPLTVGGSAAAWLIFTAPAGRGAAAAGLLVYACGVAGRWRLAFTARGVSGSAPSRRPAFRLLHANGLIVLGLAVSLQAPWAAAAALAACAAWRLMDGPDDAPPAAPREIRLAGLWALLPAAVFMLHGIVPLQ